MKIPTDNKFTQLNQGDLFGFLNDSKNMILDVPGKAILSRKPIVIMSSVVDADFKYPLSICYFSANYVAVTSEDIFEGGLNGATWSTVSSSPASLGLNSDGVVFNNYLYVTTNSNLSRWNGASTWNNTLKSLTADVPHPMCIFESLTTYKLAIGNGNTVETLDTSHNANPTVLTLDAKYQVTTMRYRNGYLYVGTRNLNGGEAKVFIWNGSGTNPQYECPVGAEWVFSMTEYGSSVAVVNSQGQLLQVNGSTAKELAAFPVFYKPDIRWQGAGGLQFNGKVFNRAMETIGNNIYINIEGDTDTGFVPEMKSGLWVYDPATGLNHRSTPVTDSVTLDTTFTVSNSIITTSAAHGMKTGDAVMFKTVTGITGVDNDHIYYATVLSTTTMKLSLSRKGVAEERYVTIGGTPSVESLVLSKNTEFGSNYGATSGAICRTVYNETPLDHFTAEVIWGCRTNDVSGTDTYVLQTFTDAFNVGTITTQRVWAEEIEETWKNLSIFMDGIETDEEQVIVKVQTTDQAPSIILNGVWADAHTIHLNSAGEFNAWKDIQEGNELVLTNGYGQGYSCHVVEGGIGETATVITLEVNEELGLAGQEIEFYFTNFKKCGDAKTREKQDIFSMLQAEIESAHSPWVMIKFEFRGFRMALNIVDLSSSIHKGTL